MNVAYRMPKLCWAVMIVTLLASYIGVFSVGCQMGRSESTFVLPVPSHVEAPVPASNEQDGKQLNTLDVDGHKITAEPGAKINVKITKNHTRDGQAKGTAIETNSDTIAQNLKTEAPNINLGADNIASNAGGTDYSGKLITSIKQGPGILFGLGAICVLLGIVSMAVPIFPTKLGLYLAIGGGVLLTCGFMFETYPFVVLGLVVATVVGGILYFILQGKSFADLQKAAKNIVGGIKQLDTETAVKVKASIGEYAERVREVDLTKKKVNEIKTKNGF